MNVGVVNKKSFQTSDGNGGKKNQAYLEMSIRPPFMTSATFTITLNKDKTKENAPDYHINYSYNRRGENYDRVRVGALWNDVSEAGNEYKRGHIESPMFPNGKMYIAVVEARQIEGMPPPTQSHNVLWSPPRADSSEIQNSNGYNQTPQSYQAPTQNIQHSSAVPAIDIDEDEIPF